MSFGVVAVCVRASTVSATPRSRLGRSPLVGQWERVPTCRELVANLKGAGLGATVAQAWVGQTSSTGQSSFKPGSPKPTRAHACTGAISRLHSHFFTASGQFGSLDWLGGQVDDAPYRIVNSDTIETGSGVLHAVFHTIGDGKLMLSPRLTKAMIREAAAHPKRSARLFGRSRSPMQGTPGSVSLARSAAEQLWVTSRTLAQPTVLGLDKRVGQSQTDFQTSPRSVCAAWTCRGR
jgi:hypothetical protein